MTISKNTDMPRISRHKMTLPNPQVSSTCSNWVGSFTCAKQIITKIDLDGPVLCSEDPILGGAVFNEREITVSNDPGLGIHGIQGIHYLAD